MQLKKTKIKPIEIFKMGTDILNSPKIKEAAKESLKTKPMKDWVKEAKAGKLNFFLSDHQGNAFQGITFPFKDEILAGIAPNLVQAYYDLAFEHIQWTEKYRETLFHTASSQFDPVKVVNERMFNRFIQYRLSGIVFLHLAVEAFLNNIIPDDHIYEKREKSNSDKFVETITKYNKAQIERWLTFKEKLDEILFSIDGLTVDKEIFSPIREKLIELSKIRDEIVHLKSKSKETKTYYANIFDFITTKDLNKYAIAVRDFLNLVSPNFIEIETLKDQRDSFELLVEKPEYLNFGLLIEVIKMKYELIKVVILKTETFSSYTNQLQFLFGHFKMLEEMNCIADYLIQDLEDKIIVEFFKNEEQLK